MKDIKEIFKDYLNSQEFGTPVWKAVLEFSRSLAESADADFEKFCKMYDTFVKKTMLELDGSTSIAWAMTVRIMRNSVV